MSEAATQDEGLAAERTRLAWRRTALGLAAGSIAVGRLLQDVVGPASWLLALVGLAAAAGMVVAALRKHATGTASAGGRLVTSCTAGAVLVAVASLLVLLHGGA